MKCAIVTPIGPGHKDDYAVCLQSVKAAWKHAHGGFTDLEILPMWDLDGKFGRSARRNTAVRKAQKMRCDWLFFLDADDLMAKSAFADVAPHLGKFDAIWGNICEAPYNNPRAAAVRPGQIPATERFDDILRLDPFITLQMGHFVRTGAVSEIGFDTALDTGEDFRYYLELWQRYRCAKVPAVFFINRRGHHATGPRSATGVDWRKAVEAEIRNVVAARGLTVQVTLDGKLARFKITNPADIIQRHLCAGLFFEQGELLSLKKAVGAGRVIVDVGANVGNHVVFYAQHMDAAKIFPVEPNPQSVALLRANIALNGLEAVVDGRGIGYGAGRAPGQFALLSEQPDNLGATRLVEGGDIPVKPLDEILQGIRPDFIKIDVEGMEFDVLQGAAGIVAQCRPLLYVEVWNDAIPRFQAWVRDNGYALMGEARLVNAVNFLAGPA